MQIAARCLEVALHKAHELHFPLAPHRRRHGDRAVAAARARLRRRHGPHQRRHHLWRARAALTSPARRKAAKALADQLPSLKSKDYGKPFADIFAAVKGDFYAIDRMLFSPAKVTVTALESGESFEGGHIDTAILSRSFSS